jgi:hypothetical protein
MNDCRKGKGKRPKPYKYLPLALAAVLFACAVSGCGTLGGVFTEGEPRFVLADAGVVPPNVQPPPIPTMLTVKEPDGSDSGRQYVLVSEEVLPENAPYIPIMSAPAESGGWASAVGGMLAGTPLGPFAPVAGLLLAKLFATRRGREHGMNAAKAAAKLDLGGAAKALIAADGWRHTSEVAPPAKSA